MVGRSVIQRLLHPRPPMSVLVKVFGCRPHDGGSVDTGAGVRKTSNGGNRGMCGEDARQTLRGFGGCEYEYNFCDMARTLRMGENAFRRSCNFRGLGVVKKAHIATCALSAWWQPLYRIGRTNIST